MYCSTCLAGSRLSATGSMFGSKSIRETPVVKPERGLGFRVQGSWFKGGGTTPSARPRSWNLKGKAGGTVSLFWGDGTIYEGGRHCLELFS